MKPVSLFLALAAAAVAVLACTPRSEPPSPTRAADTDAPDYAALQVELDAARARWAAEQPAAYDLEFTWWCMLCGPERRNEVRVSVTSGSVSGVAYAYSGADALPTPDPSHFHTVDELFALVQQAIGDSADRIVVEYSPGLGYPARFHTDPNQFVYDDEYGFTVAALTAPAKE